MFVDKKKYIFLKIFENFILILLSFNQSISTQENYNHSADLNYFGLKLGIKLL